MCDEPKSPEEAEMAILVLDAVESVRKMATNERRYIGRWRTFLDWAKKAVPDRQGRLVNTLGDGIRACFPDVRLAADFAFSANEWTIRNNDSDDQTIGLSFRIGIHIAMVVLDDTDVYGNGVNLTARLSEQAKPGGVVVSAEARDQLVDGVDGEVTDLGLCYLRHVAEPVHAYAVATLDRHYATTEPAGSSETLVPLVGVLPFARELFAREPDAIGSLFAERLIYQVGNKGELDVLPLLSAQSVFGRQLSVSDIGKLLGVSHVVSGNYQEINGQIDGSLGIVEVSSKRNLWEESFRFSVADLLLIDADPILRIVEVIHNTLLSVAEKRVREWPLRNIDSHSMLMGAVSIMHRANTDQFDRAGDALEYLADLHRRNPIPKAWLAEWHVLRITRGIANVDKDTIARAIAQTDRALDLDDKCALALTMRGMIQCQMMKDLEAASVSCAQAIEANPSESFAWLFTGVLRSFEGNADAAAPAAEQALRLSPLNPLRYFYLSLAASALLPTENYHRVIELARESARLNQFHPSTFRVLAIACAMIDDIDSARVAVSRLMDLEPGFTVTQFLQRAPSANTRMGPLCAEAFRRAGVPE